MTTGSWVIRSSDCGHVKTVTENGGIVFGHESDACVFPTKTSALAALRGYRRAPGEVVEVVRSVLHEESARARKDWR